MARFKCDTQYLVQSRGYYGGNRTHGSRSRCHIIPVYVDTVVIKPLFKCDEKFLSRILKRKLIYCIITKVNCIKSCAVGMPQIAHFPGSYRTLFLKSDRINLEGAIDLIYIRFV